MRRLHARAAAIAAALITLVAVASIPSIASIADSPHSVTAGVTVIYVDAAAVGANDGTSWRDAFMDLQDALAAAQSGAKIWVARGIYPPGPPDAGREVTFSLVSGATVYGGFAGWEDSIDQRNWKENETVLTAELEPDGFRVNTVITALEPGAGTSIDGFTITLGGFFQNSHGGLHQQGGTLSVANCRFILNRPAINVQQGELELLNCDFVQNFTDATTSGGAVRAMTSSLQATYCSFIDNHAGEGGAIHFQNSGIVLEGCTFQDNRARFGGSAIASWTGGTLHISGCTFRGNWNSPALHTVPLSALTIEDSSFIENDGGIIASSPATTITRCEFIGNHSDFEGGALFGGGLIMDSIFLNNSSFFEGGALRTSGTVINCRFEGNFSHTRSGGGIATRGGLTIMNCEFTDNIGSPAHPGGGAVYNYGSSIGDPFLTMINCVLNGNSTGAVHVGSSLFGPGTAEIINCTIMDHQLWNPPEQAALMVHPGSHAVVRNSILWNNGSGAESDQIKGSAEVSHSIVQGLDPAGPYAGPGVIGDDPLFADADGRLSPMSPAIDAGLNEFLPPGIETDLDGKPRFVDGSGDGEAIVDMGAFELQEASIPCVPADLNCDGIVDHHDLILLLAAWGPCPPPESAAPTERRGLPPRGSWQGGASGGTGGSCPADLNNSGAVDVQDLLILLANWG